MYMFKFELVVPKEAEPMPKDDRGVAKTIVDKSEDSEGVAIVLDRSEQVVGSMFLCDYIATLYQLSIRRTKVMIKFADPVICH